MVEYQINKMLHIIIVNDFQTIYLSYLKNIKCESYELCLNCMLKEVVL